MAGATPHWVDPVMRIGFAARGAVYIVVGGFAFLAALGDGYASGTKGSLERLLGSSWGFALLAFIAFGLVAFAAWRGLCALMDLEARGGGAKGWVARGGQVISGLTHLGLAVFALSLVWGGGGQSGQGGSSTEDWTAMLLRQPFGQWLVGILGLVVIAVGVRQLMKAHQEKFKRYLAASQTSERLTPVVKFGIDAHGVVIGIIGGFLIFAALTANPQRAGGLGQVLDTVRQAIYGQVLLGIVGAGLIAFAVFCFIEARYRIVPRLAESSGTRTLAMKAQEAKGKAQEAKETAQGPKGKAERTAQRLSH